MIMVDELRVHPNAWGPFRLGSCHLTCVGDLDEAAHLRTADWSPGILVSGSPARAALRPHAAETRCGVAGWRDVRPTTRPASASPSNHLTSY